MLMRCDANATCQAAKNAVDSTRHAANRIHISLNQCVSNVDLIKLVRTKLVLSETSGPNSFWSRMNWFSIIGIDFASNVFQGGRQKISNAKVFFNPTYFQEWFQYFGTRSQRILVHYSASFGTALAEVDCSCLQAILVQIWAEKSKMPQNSGLKSRTLEDLGSQAPAPKSATVGLLKELDPERTKSRFFYKNTMNTL